MDQPVDDRAADPGDSPASPEAAAPPSVVEDGEPLRLVRIGVEADPEPYPDDPWLPGSRRPDRRALVIGVVVIAGLLAVASTAWLVGANQPQAGSAHHRHLSQATALGSGHAQPSQALSGHPVPRMPPTTQPAPAQTGPGAAQPGQRGHSQTRQGQTGHSQSRSGHPGTRRTGTGRSSAGHNSTPQPGSTLAGGHHTGSGQSGTSGPGNGQPGTSSPGNGQGRQGQPGPGQAGSSRTGSGHAGPGPSGSLPSRPSRTGTVRSSTPPAPQPRQSAPAPRRGTHPRLSAHGIVSIGAGLAGRSGVRRVAALLDGYFAAVNHREYQAYARLFAQPRALTPREFAWGYQTSHDSKAMLVGVAALEGGLKATVTFTSHQDPAESPDHSSCIDWRIALFLHRADSGYLIGMPPSGYRADLQACPFALRQAAQRHSGLGHSGLGHARHASSRHWDSRHSTFRHSGSRHSGSRHGGSRHGGSQYPAFQYGGSRHPLRTNR